ncbi:MAG: imidazole glycerol phosphate synthase subunit HisH [Hylemonella sp.]
MIAIIDYDIGNLAAVANMFKRIGVECEITAEAEKIDRAERLVLPGNGAYDACMKGLRQTGLIPLLEQKVLQQETPLLGICVGAQMLGSDSEEGGESGLGWIDMQVKKFPESLGVKVPHMGWSEVSKAHANDPLIHDLDDDARFYFVHSFYMEPKKQSDVLLTAHYGIDFAAAVRVGNIVGVQFHPEKSHRYGKHLLERFAQCG